MADTELYMKQQRLDYQLPFNQTNPSKFSMQFMYKAVIVAIFLVLLPLFPSLAPEFVNQSLHTRSWELVHVLLVGIALSYGLFSRNNDDTEKEYSSKFDNAQSYVSRLLQVSSVFDDESDSSSPYDENKVQTWSSQYFSGQPVVVVAQENSVHDEKQHVSASKLVVDKPLVLPVRRLKLHVPYSDFSETVDESILTGGSLSRSTTNPGSKRFSSNYSESRNGEVDGSVSTDLEVKTVEYDVLRSTIRWRSISGRIEMKEENDDDVPLYSLPPSMEESDFSRIMSQSKPTFTSHSSQKRLTSSKLSESQSKNVEDVPRKKVYYKSSPPPAPPLPPTRRKSAAVESKRSVRSVPMELTNGSERGEIQDSANSEAIDGSLTGRSVRTIRPWEPVCESTHNTGFVDYFEVEEKQEFEENVAVETDEESESEEKDGLFHGGSKNENEEIVSKDVTDGGKDVDKKADEFIAKFREQIRLQRIESIKRSTGQIARKSNS